MIRIRQAVYEDIPRIMQFIDENWKKGHIMGNDRVMFEFQHVRDNEVFYIIAEDDVDKRIYGTMGYIPMSSYPYPYVSHAMIQSLDNPENRMLGEEMAKYFEENIECSNVISVGMNTRYAKAIQVLGENNIGLMEHYYMLNAKSEYKVAHITHYEEIETHKKGVTFIPLYSIDEWKESLKLELRTNRKPFCDLEYLEHRYFKHPYFKYFIWGLKRNDEMNGIIVAREVEQFGNKILRIVDYYGLDEEISYAGEAFKQLMRDKNYEYIDFYCYGIEHSIMQDAGFVLREKNDTNIIPNHFCPYERKNVDIYFFTWFMDGIHVYRGFGDQDRPNFIYK